MPVCIILVGLAGRKVSSGIDDGCTNVIRDLRGADKSAKGARRVLQTLRRVHIHARHDLRGAPREFALFDERLIGVDGDDESGGYRELRPRDLAKVGAFAVDLRDCATIDVLKPADERRVAAGQGTGVRANALASGA